MIFIPANSTIAASFLFFSFKSNKDDFIHEIESYMCHIETRKILLNKIFNLRMFITHGKKQKVDG